MHVADSETQEVSARSLSDSDLKEIDNSEFGVGKPCILEADEGEVAVSGRGVLPSMPSVRARRSTRVFVPKSIVKASSDADSSPRRVLRSGKGLFTELFDAEYLSDVERIKSWKLGLLDAVDGCDEALGGCIFPPTASAAPPVQKMTFADPFDRVIENVYSRKRQKRAMPDGRRLDDRMCEIHFVREQRKKKQPTAKKPAGRLSNFLCRRNFREGPLFISVEPNWSSLSQFSCVLLSILSWIRSRSRFPVCKSFLQSMKRDFALDGINFIFEPHRSSNLSCRNSRQGCIIYGVHFSVPLASVNFSALPFFFIGLHLRMQLGRQYLPTDLAISLAGFPENSRRAIISYGENNSFIPVGNDDFSGKGLETPMQSLRMNVVDRVFNASECNIVRHTAKRRNSKLKDFPNKRSFRLQRTRNHRSMVSPGDNSCSELVHKFLSVTEASAEQYVALETEMSLEMRSKCFKARDGRTTFSSPRVQARQKRSARNSTTEKMEEFKSILLDLKQNIDLACSNANILVIESDRCWREKGAEIILECSATEEWCLAIRKQGSVKYLYKPQEIKANSTLNRYTRAMIWSGESGWKLEFCDRKDWWIFKELHRECCERNVQAPPVRMIPIPGVHEVLDYMEESNALYSRPNAYISVREDEVERALMSHNVNYDMDSEDEACIQQLNFSLDGSENGKSQISFDIFEKIIFHLEKAAYSHPDDVSDVEKATKLCVDLGNRDLVAAIYEYWSRKRKQRQLALVRVFQQGQPSKRPQLIPKHFLRRKRSLKKQTAKGGRGKAESVLQAMAEKEVLRRVEAAEAAAEMAVEAAVIKRRKAQMLMQNADMLTYKAVVGMRLADAVSYTGPGDQHTTVTDWILS